MLVGTRGDIVDAGSLVRSLADVVDIVEYASMNDGKQLADIGEDDVTEIPDDGV